MKTVSFIGCGNMGGAVAAKLAEDGRYRIKLYSPRSAAEKAAEIKAEACPSLQEAVRADIIILAVKPQVLPSLYDELSKAEGSAFISLAAGVPLEVLEARLKSSNIARFMPNLAAKEGLSVTAAAFSSSADEDFRKEAMQIAGMIGSAFELDEKLFPAFIGISGSAIAFIFEFVHALAMGGVSAGIPYPTAASIAAETLESAAAALRHGDDTPPQIMTKVCSAGGTTIKGMEELYKGGFDSTVINAVLASCTKSIELEKSAKESLK